MNKDCFVKICSDENIKKIDIDPRLIDSFKRVMHKIQNFFNTSGISLNINYEDYLKKYLLDESDRKLSIIVDELEPQYGGEYSAFEATLVINSDVIENNPEELDHVLCHEFIHFLVHHYMDILFSVDMSGETLIDEALTELLSREIFPSQCVYYGPIPNLMDFYFNISGSKVYISDLFNHKIPELIRKGYFPKTFIIHGNNCMEKYDNGEYINGGYERDSEYLGVQRDLITQFANFQITNFEELKNAITILSNRPAMDEEWTTNHIIECSKTYLNNCDNQNEIYEYINLCNTLKNYNNKTFYSFDFYGSLLFTDRNKVYSYNENGIQLRKDISFWNTYNKGKEAFDLSDKSGNKLKINVEDTNICSINDIVSRRLNELELILSSQKDLK